MILRRLQHFFFASRVLNSVLSSYDFADVELIEGLCPLTCLNGGVCRPGNLTTALSTNFPWLSSSSANYYCQCRVGYAGPDCSVPYEACRGAENEAPRKNPDFEPTLAVCFQGGTCGFPGGGVCNCSGAVSTNGTRYTGRHCEVPIPLDPACSEGQFCLNDGKCHPELPDRCECPAGFQGAQCETPVPDPEAASSEECTLPCQNGGICVHGVSPEAAASPLPDVPSIDDMHCECPNGYQGVLCQYQVDVCGGGEHLCLHGSRCVRDADGSFRCECDPTEKDRVCRKEVDRCRPTAGSYAGGHPEFFESTAAPAFCINGGRCREILWGDYLQYGCDCPALFHGPHCEWVKNGLEVLADLRAADANNASNGNDLRRYGLASLGISLVAFILTGALYYGRFRWRVRRGWWGRCRRPGEDGLYNKNLYSFREENAGVTTANGNLFFPAYYAGAGSSAAATSGEGDEEGDELIILHDVDIT